jgi:hypothetical protein
MNTRIEILKDGFWKELILSEQNDVKYNAIINSIGSISGRQLQHTNTFTLPYVKQNIDALGINVFNKKELAKAFNIKYVAKYLIKDKLFQSGFLLINNTEMGEINVNFIDEALDIVEKWGTSSYFDLLNADLPETPQIYKDAILEMTEYKMSKTTVLPALTNISGKTYGIAKYPNNLNAIGDKFQISQGALKLDGTRENDLRLDDSFNPYQSRPIFNVKALFDIAIESYGYTPYYDNSIDWAKLENTYMIDKDLFQSQNDNFLVKKIYTPVVENTSHNFIQNDLDPFDYRYNTSFVYPDEANAFFPNDLNPPPNFNLNIGASETKNYKVTDKMIVVPNLSNIAFGSLTWKCNYTDFMLDPYVISLWYPTTAGDPFIQSVMTKEVIDDGTLFIVKSSKSQLSVVPSGADRLFGVAMVVDQNSDDFKNQQDVFISNMIFEDEFLPKGAISYDEFNQYESNDINLTHAAPRDTIKNVLSAIMDREGILISIGLSNILINGVVTPTKTIKLFSYGSYETRKTEGNYQDWTKYHLQYISPLYNTDYGQDYAKNNEIALSDPFKGNSAVYQLTNQGSDSKYKDFTQNFSKLFKDVEAIDYVANTNSPYFEYTNKGLGLVEVTGSITGLAQIRASQASQGTISSLPAVSNVNGLIIPSGMKDWYNIIDESVRSEASFLLPIEVVKNVELAEPIYVESLGGFYIIESIQEYVDSETNVRVKLIKLIINQYIFGDNTYIFQNQNDYTFQQGNDYLFNN